MLTRKIHSSGEELPVIGLGTWIQFDVGDSKREQEPLKECLKLMSERGARLIDSSPMYGRSEQVVGKLTQSLHAHDYFFATKVWTEGEREGIRQMESSMKKMQREKMDLLQVHNLVDYKIHLKTLRKWKEEGRVRYIGVTHYTVSAHAILEKVIKEEQPDFVQFNYSIGTRNAEKSLLSTAFESGVSVIINEPLEKGNLFKFVKDKPLPAWADEYHIHSWAEFFLKYILSNPAVNCVIPGTSNPAHMKEILNAGKGTMPDEKARQKMLEWWERM